MIKRPGLHVRLLLAGCILIGAATFTLGYVGVTVIHEFVLSRFEERIFFLARYLALNSELGVLIGERHMLSQLAGNLLSEKDVVGVAVLNKDDVVLAEESKQMTEKLSIVEVPVIVREASEDSLSFFRTGSEWPGEEVIGKVRITYTTEGIDKLLQIMRDRFIRFAVGLALLSALIFFVISRSVVAPVTQLVNGARQVARGMMNFRAKPGSLPETRELALAFNAMLDSLEENRKALDAANQEMIRQKTLAEMGKFSLMVAHEVKNPLSIIKSSIDLLKKGTEDSEDKMLFDYIEEEIKRLNRLIEDFLQFARPTTPMFRTVDANAMLADIVLGFEIQTARSTVDIQADIPEETTSVNGDPDLLNRVFGNILKNALDASRDGDVVRISSLATENIWMATIEDEGPGISEENLARIFEPFFTTRSKGTGLGLAYALQVVETHQGMIDVENRESGGARFIIRLPLLRELGTEYPTEPVS